MNPFHNDSNWEDVDCMLLDFEQDPDSPEAQIDGVLFIGGDFGDYEEDAFILFHRDGKLFEVNGSHCSCYGWEGQWEPEETTPDAIRMRYQPYDPNWNHRKYMQNGSDSNACLEAALRYFENEC